MNKAASFSPPSLPALRRARALPDSAEIHAPVVIVGAGACGLTAALILHDLGIESVVLERDAAPAGSTALSSGFIPAGGTRLQQERGVADSPAAFAADIAAKARHTAAPHLVAAYTEAIPQAIDALQARHGIPFLLLEGFLYPGHHLPRMHAVPEKTGLGLMTRLEQAARSAGIAILGQARVEELWVDAEDKGNSDNQDKVLGVGYVRPDGQMEYVGCDALILACNGFGGNKALVSELLPEMRDAVFAGHMGNDGSAIAWGRQLGAALADLGGCQGHGSWAVPHGVLVSWGLMMQGGIQVNALGQRFHDETQGYSEAALSVLAQPGGVAWYVFDSPLLEFAREFPDFREAESAGAVRVCAELEQLAALIACPASSLQMTLDTVTSVARTGQPASDGRLFQCALEAPFHAVKVTGALFHTQGGLDIDAHCRVLRRDGVPFPNLLAAGGAARGVSGNAVWGYLSGNGLLSAVAGGFIAAHTVAQQRGKNEREQTPL